MGKTALKNLLSLVGEAEKASPIAESFLNQLIQSIEMTANKNNKKPSAHYKPSSMNCIRNMYYQMIEADMDPSLKEYEGVGIAESGTDRHERIQKAVIAMKANGFDCEYIDVEEYVNSHNLTNIEVKGKSGVETRLFNKAFNISFLCDGIIKFKDKYYILEIKTEAAKKWQSRDSVDENHHKQATAYALSLGINEIIFLYENRDLCNKKAYLFNVTDQMKESLICLLQTCDEYLDLQIVPPKPVVSTKICQYCAYKTRCRRDK